MIREKYNLMQELHKKDEQLVGENRLSMVGQGDFPGANNIMRGTMNIKHHTQHLTIDNPEVPFIFDGKENVVGENSSFYTKTDKTYQVIDIIKKYDEMLKGKSRFALYFLYCKEDDSYMVVERKEVENLTESFGFAYNNDYLDATEEGDIIPKNTMICGSTSYDEDGNVSIGINGRILNAVHPAVQDDAIIVSESFAKRMVANNVISIVIPISDSTMLLNLYGDNNEYVGLPNIGDIITDGTVAATRGIKESRMFSDMRDSSLKSINKQTDQVFYCSKNSEIIDINIYCNNPNIKAHKENKQILQYYNDARWFYTRVYKTCKKITKSGSSNIDEEINRWMRLAMNYLDTQAVWAYNDNIFSNVMIEILLRKKEELKIGRKITGRHGNKTVVCSVWPDEWMPYLTTETIKDQYGVVHAKGTVERVDMITNPLSFINRTIPMALNEGSASFILDRARKHALTLETHDEQRDFLFDVLRILNPIETKEVEDIYYDLSDREKKHFISDMISVDRNGLIITNNGTYLRWEVLNEDFCYRDNAIKIYEKYGDIIQPYHIFMPKPKWKRDVYVGQDYVGYQYIMMLKQSGEKGFSVRSAGAISDESLPEKSHDNKISKLWHSEKPIRFGEYETPNFMIITNPEDFALITALYRTSIDGRRWMYEAILSDDGKYNIPDNFTSRSSEILQVYLKSLGVGMETIFDEDEYIGEPEHETEVIGYTIGNSVIFCTINEMYYLKKMHKVYKRYIKENPNTIDDMDELWDYMMENLPFKKKYLTDNIVNMFKNNIEAFSIMG